MVFASSDPKVVDEGSTLLRRMEICVSEAEKRSGKTAMSMQETFTVYLVETRQAWERRRGRSGGDELPFTLPILLARLADAGVGGRSPAPNFLWRRYSEFELLRSYLMVTYPYIVIPPLPEKRVGSDPNALQP